MTCKPELLLLHFTRDSTDFVRILMGSGMIHSAGGYGQRQILSFVVISGIWVT